MDNALFIETAEKARKAALDAATDYRAKWGSDGGACNFDSCAIMARRSTLDLLTQAGLSGYYKDYGMWRGYILVRSPIGAQGGLNTCQAEAMCKVFREAGVEATVYYQMD